MIHFRLIGKIVLWLAFTLPVTMAAAAPDGDPEESWLRLERAEYGAARRASAGRTSILAQWVSATAAMMLDEQEEVPDTPPARSAALFSQRDFNGAAEILEPLLASRERDAGVPADLLCLRLRLAACWVEIGRAGQADSLLTVAVEQARNLGLPVAEGYGLLTRGRGRVRLGRGDDARQDLLAALARADELGLPRWSGTAAIALSVVSRLQMDLGDALAWREKALAYYRAGGDLAGQARALHYIGAIRLMQGDLTRALVFFQQALELARETGDAGVQAGILGEMANVNYLLGDFDAALDQYDEAIRLAPNPWRRGMMLINLGSLYEFQERYTEALAAQLEALELMRQVGDSRNEAEALMSLGETRCEMKDFTAGLADLEQAIAMARESDNTVMEAFALKSKGHGLLDSGDLDGAVTALAEATAVARRCGYFDILEWSLLGEAMVARRQGRLEDALISLEEALEEVASVRRRSAGSADVTSGIVSQAAGIYAETIDVLYHLHLRDPDRGYDRRAFAVAQQAKARAFLDLLAEAEFDLRFSAVPSYRVAEGEILTRMAGLEQDLAGAIERGAPADTVGSYKARLAGASDELHLLEARLRAEDPRYAQVLYPEPLDLERLGGEVLRPGEVFLEYALGDSASYLWAIKGDQLRFAALPSRAVLEEKVRQLLPLLQDYNLSGGSPAWFKATARELYRILIEPVADLVASSPRLVVSPDGVLNYLPFDVLLTTDSSAERWRDLPWLIRGKTVTVTPSASVLDRVRGREHRSVGDSWLLVGDPVLVAGSEAGILARAAGAGDLPSLPHAAEELAGLARLAPADHCRVLAGQGATVPGLRAAATVGSFRLVHFATHGLLNEARPRYSGLVLSPDPVSGDEGFLTVSEVLGLPLACDQVVLSACSTALGQEISGEGLVGLTRSFIFAGARSVVASLWDVSDEAAARFMADFYGRLTDPAVDRAEALARTKRALIQGGGNLPESGAVAAHPAFWAAFVLSGDGR